MGYTKPIETENAIYVLSLEDHFDPDYSLFFRMKGYGDAVVLEHQLKDNPAEINFGDFKRPHVPVFFIDPEFTSSYKKKYIAMTSAEAGLKLGAIGLLIAGKPAIAGTLFGLSQLVAPSLHKLLSPNRTREYAVINPNAINVRAFAALERMFNPLIVNARDAIFAEKVEESIAPALNAELGRKPVIVLRFGGGHVGVVRYLKNQILRRKVLFRLKKRINQGLKKEHLDKIVRMDWNSSQGTRFTELRAAVSKHLSPREDKESRFSRWRRVVAGFFRRRRA